MSKHEGIDNDGGLEDMQRLLERFRPVGPPAELRARALAVQSAYSEHRPGRIALYIWRASVAAGLVAAIWLHLAADDVSARLAGQIGIGPAVWTQEEERVAQMLDGDGWGRRYLATALRAGPLQSPSASALDASNFR